MSFTVEDAKRVQRDLGLTGVHVVYLDGTGFVLAHTDAERAVQLMVSLWECRFHYWLTKLGSAEWVPYLWQFPQLPGWYKLPDLVTCEGLAL